MAVDAFIDYLGSVASAVRQIPVAQSKPQNPDMDFPEVEISTTEKLLRSIPELERLDGARLRAISSSSSLSFRRTAISVLERLSLGDEPEKIRDDLVDFVSRERIQCFYLSGISGISLSKRLPIADNVELVTANDVPSCSAREFVFRIDRGGRIIGAGHEPSRPQAALRVRVCQPAIIAKGSKPPDNGNATMKAIRKLEEDILFCLTLSSTHAAPAINSATSWIDHPANSYHGIAGGGGGSSPNMMYSGSHAEFDRDLAIRLYSQIDSLNKKDRDLLLLAVNRLARSRMHEEVVNRAIDLGIALEALFVQERNSQELSYRASVRAARFLGANEEERREIAIAVRKAYASRSTAVHTGQLKNHQKQYAILSRADELCRIASIKFVENKRIPADWDAVVFGN